MANTRKAILCFLFRSEIGKTVKRNEPRLKTALLTKKNDIKIHFTNLHKTEQKPQKGSFLVIRFPFRLFHGKSCRQSI